VKRTDFAGCESFLKGLLLILLPKGKSSGDCIKMTEEDLPKDFGERIVPVSAKDYMAHYGLDNGDYDLIPHIVHESGKDLKISVELAMSSIRTSLSRSAGNSVAFVNRRFSIGSLGLIMDGVFVVRKKRDDQQV